MSKKRIKNNLLIWYDNNKRILPWRDNPTPYRVWVSEIMLQQTRVQTVIPYFNRFLEQLPNINALANAEDDQLRKLWEGLGYYNRVRNLKEAANQILLEYNGEIPKTYDEIISLRGIGEYTAGAVLSIAFGKQYTAVDGNVLRVFARVLGVRDNIKDPKVKQSIRDYVKSILPKERTGDFNQSLMEVGATICLPNGKPYCEVCPIKDYCKAYKQNIQLEIPVKRKSKEVPIEKKTVIVVKYQDKFLIKQRDNKGLLAGLYQFPLFEGHLSKEVPIEKKTVIVVKYQDKFLIKQRENKGLLAGLYQFPLFEGHLSKEEALNNFPNLTIKRITSLNRSKHVFSHKIWDMKAFQIEVDKEGTNIEFYHKNDIKQYYAIPTAFKEYKKLLE